MVRKVRFYLPETASSDSEDETDVSNLPPKVISSIQNLRNFTVKDTSKVHGTARYINGTLNFCNNDYVQTNTKESTESSNAKVTNERGKKLDRKPVAPPRKSESKKIHPASNGNESSNVFYWEKALNGCTVTNSKCERPSRSMRRTPIIRSCTTILMSPTNFLRRSPTPPRKNKHKTPDTLQVPIKISTTDQLAAKKSKLKDRISDCFRVDHKFNQRKIDEQMALLNLNDQKHRSVEYVPVQVNGVTWTVYQPPGGNNGTSNWTNNQNHNCSGGKVRITNVMSIQKIPLITTLLRASRNQDEELMQCVLENILTNGMSEEDLNAADCSGRTALSYMCSTNVTRFLEILLQAPGIDINKPDVELNTPLHYAAECGQFGAIRLLLQQSKLNIDVKNIFGFTPLMKAAIQGHVRCAKTLLFAGASPVEIDYKRQLCAEQWARFCGRHSCAEVIEKCSRTRLLDKNTLNKWSHDPCLSPNEQEKFTIKQRARANSAVQATTIKPSNDGGIRSKISRVFNFVSRDKSNSSNSNKSSGSPTSSTNIKSPDKNNANIRTTLYNSSHTLVSRSDGYLNKSLMRPLEVPKLEVTSPHNQELIRKYEKRYSLGNNESGKPPALPPRRNSKIMF